MNTVLLHATRTRPPAVENVAVSGDATVVGGGMVVGGVGAVVGVVGGRFATVVGLVGVPEPARSVVVGDAGRVVVVGGGRRVVVGVMVVDVGPTAPDASWLTTSRWATTGAGRSVTSEATMDVAVQTIAVETAVTPNHIPTAMRRRTSTHRGCPVVSATALSGP